MMMEDRFLKRLRKKARKGLRGWPIATIAFYGPNLSQATKVTVGIVPSENAEVEELRDWKVDDGEIRADPHHDSNRVLHRSGPGSTWSGHQPQPTGRQSHGRGHLKRGGSREAA